MDKKNKDITYFISFCIEQYMHTKGMSEAEVMATFNKLKYLTTCANTLKFCTHRGI